VAIFAPESRDFARGTPLDARIDIPRYHAIRGQGAKVRSSDYAIDQSGGKSKGVKMVTADARCST